MPETRVTRVEASGTGAGSAGTPEGVKKDRVLLPVVGGEKA